MVTKIVYYYAETDSYWIRKKDQEYGEGKPFAHNTLSNNATNDQLNKQAEFYTRTINNIQQEEQNKAQQAFLALTDLGITAIDSWNSASELITETGELTFDIAKKPYQLKGRTGIGKNNYIPYSKGHPILSKVGEKAVDGTLLHSEIEVELANKKMQGSLIKDEDIKEVNERISGKIVGAVISKTKDRAEDINSMVETINEAKKVYDKFNKGKRINFEKDLAKTKEFGREQLGAFFAVWAPAIVEVKGWDKYNNLQSLGKVERAKKIEEFKKDVQLIVKYNRIAAHVMETMMMLGSLLIQSTIPIGKLAGLILIVLAQPISNSVKEILIKENNDQGNELRLGDYTTIVINNIVEWFDMTRFVGDSNLCLKQEYNNRPLIQERRIDAPGLIAGMKAFIKDGPFEKLFIQLENLVLGKDIKAFDAKTYGQQLEEKYHVETKLKDIAMHYGPLATIGEFIKDKDKDFSFVAFFDCKEKAATIMDRIIENTFERIDGKEKYQVYAYKEVEHAKDIPRLIHYNKRSKSNQIVVYRTKEQKGTAPVYFKRAAPGAAQMYKAANTETKVETRPKPYLEQLKKSFSKGHLRKLLRQRIEVGYGESWYDNDYYHMVSLKSLLNKEAKEYGLNLAKDDISYKEILNQYNNRKFIKEGLVGNVFGQDGMKYDYIMIEDSLFAKEPNFFGPNWNIMYGSIKNQDKEQEERSTKQANTGSREFWTGLGSRKIYKQPADIKKTEIIINGQKIGQNLKRKCEDESIFAVIAEQFFKEREYIETFKEDDGRVLEVRYKHFTYQSFFKAITNPVLKIKYRYKHKGCKKSYPWNRLTIKGFADLDYGINLPDRGYSLAGSRYDGEIKKDRLQTDLIDISEITKKGRGKLKVDSKYLKADELTNLEIEERTKKTYKIKPGDTLWQIAEDFLDKGSRWEELKKEDGSSYSEEEEVEKLQVGSKVIIPYKSNGVPVVYQDLDKNKYTKDSEGALLINYLEEDTETETLRISDFQEGDYGLWIEQEASYCLEGNSIINNATGEKAPKDKVLAKEENTWLKEEERIKDNFLWIYPNEEIVWPEVENKEESGEETDENKQKEQTEAVISSGSIASAEVTATKESSTQSQKATKNNENRGSTQARLYVCDGAKLQCNQGDKKSTFKVIDIHNVYIQGKPMATIQDSKPMVNIKPFGKCKSMANPTVAAATAANHGNLKKMPCQPNISAPWQGGKDDVTITGIPTVLETSKLNCAYAGVIKVVDPGQDLVRE